MSAFVGGGHFVVLSTALQMMLVAGCNEPALVVSESNQQTSSEVEFLWVEIPDGTPPMRLEPNRGSLVEVPADDSNFSYNYGYRSLYWKDWLAVSTGKDQQWLPLVGLPGNFVERSLKVSKRKPAMPLYQAVARVPVRYISLVLIVAWSR